MAVVTDPHAYARSVRDKTVTEQRHNLTKTPHNNVEDDSEDEKEGSDVDVSIVNFGTFICDGGCFRPPAEYTELHECVRCDNVHFCDTCLKKLRDGTLPFRVCGKGHELVQIFPVDQALLDIVTVKVEGKTVAKPEWLARVKKEWNITLEEESALSF